MRNLASIAVVTSLLLGGVPFETVSSHSHHHDHGMVASDHAHHHDHPEAFRHDETPGEASGETDVGGFQHLIVDATGHGHTHAVGNASDLQFNNSFRRSKLSPLSIAVASKARGLGYLTRRTRVVLDRQDCVDSLATSTDLLASVVLLV